jgi:L-iditol 2-dehydrogenase
MQNTYKAGVYKDLQNRLVAVEDWPMHEVGPKDVLIKTVRSSICGSDTGAMGPDNDKEFGHETVGYVKEVGEEVIDFKVGDRVWPHPTYIMTGRYSCQLPGFSEFILVHEPRVNKELWPVPDNVTDNMACLVEPFGVGTRGKNRPGAKPGDHVVVYGAGSIGLFCMSSLVAQGITPVAVDIILSDYKRALLKEMGVIVAPLPEEGDKLEFIKELWGELPQRQSGMALNVDIVVDCAGAPNVVEDFFKMRKENSRLVTLGINRPREVPLASMMSSEMIIMGSSGYNDSDIEEVFSNLANGKVPWIEKVITHHYRQEQLQEALNMAMNREEAIKVVIDMV